MNLYRDLVTGRIATGVTERENIKLVLAALARQCVQDTFVPREIPRQQALELAGAGDDGLRMLDKLERSHLIRSASITENISFSLDSLAEYLAAQDVVREFQSDEARWRELLLRADELALPAGPLREPVTQGVARADAAVLVGDGAPDLAGFRGPVLRAHLVADGGALVGRPVFAFAGIGRPEKFIASLEASGAKVIGSCFFADHHPYSEDEILELKAIAGEALLVTTEKDFVRLSIASREGIKVLKVSARFDDAAAMERLLDSAAPRP